MTWLPLEKTCALPSTVVLGEIMHASEYLDHLETLASKYLEPIKNPPGAYQKPRRHLEPVRQLQLHYPHLTTTQLVSSHVFRSLSILRHFQGSQAS